MIHAIQQLGLGVQDKRTALEWFARVLGFRTVVFNEQNEATFMARYTGNQVCRRDAAFVLNSHGGAGLEIWQHLSRQPVPQPKDMSLRSTGFLVCKLRCKGLDQIVAALQQDPEPSLQRIGEITVRPTGERCHYFSVFGTWFQLLEDKRKFFREGSGPFCAGVSGLIAGVSDMERSLKFYRKVLGYSHIVQDKEGEWQDWSGFRERDRMNEGKFRRVILQRAEPESGLYSRFLGVGELELIEAINSPLGELQQTVRESLHLSSGRHLYKDRYWGDPGLIHLCLDVTDISALHDFCQTLGMDFTVDTGTGFSMDKTAVGRFAYLEDPDGSLIEFVETYRIPLLKKLGFSLNVQNRQRPLPRWILKLASRNNYRKN